ncbi:PREDICTED: phosphatidylinositol 4-phosphate 5-kinase 5-like isoform X2 [Camelina sativa]|uniref:Phosphatidylinositol 4-phosphate 5-kinase 5-like isoform X1 n=1 Tax=Camelina sativa TaxID=90675 RepID=A0ABM0Z2V1_CAMSA|nr:PREDICTED: phosphatidylinositol 4-phosphate 5-kinase 5-like isoform X1 [Camelina sativa]XP_010509643.1 PREDICTED: phosphatidylinositol 4-phosphate 5-kinase 5-like isoform X2 [Camelina sativa]
MHLKNSSVTERRFIGKEDSDQSPDNNPQDHHLTVDIPISTPHKRSVVAQPSNISAAAADRFRRGRTRARLGSVSSFSPTNLFSFLSSCRPVIVRFLRKLLRHILRARLICFHLRFLLLLAVPPLYVFFLVINLRIFLRLIFALIALSFIFSISLRFALPHLPSIRLFVARLLTFLPARFASSSQPRSTNQVVWSIGSKPVSEINKTNSGSWVQKFGSDDVYEGEFHKGKCSGSGVYYYSMKGKYEGEWIDGKYDGYGVETWAKGSRYRGQYRLGLRHGIGVYTFYTGDVYAGEWSNGQCHGCGVYTSEDGSRYDGEFKWGVKHGLGCYHFRNGDSYAGEYFADKMHGFGVYQFGNGHKYEGAWHEGRRQGLGMYTFRTGETQAGHWEDGILSCASEQTIRPGSSFTISHSKVVDTVEQARKAAERAKEVVKVEERIKRVVMAANRAANAARVAAVKAVQAQTFHRNGSDLGTV